jgi:hypothetical protein
VNGMVLTASGANRVSAGSKFRRTVAVDLDDVVAEFRDTRTLVGAVRAEVRFKHRLGEVPSEGPDQFHRRRSKKLGPRERLSTASAEGVEELLLDDVLRQERNVELGGERDGKRRLPRPRCTGHENYALHGADSSASALTLDQTDAGTRVEGLGTNRAVAARCRFRRKATSKTSEGRAGAPLMVPSLSPIDPAASSPRGSVAKVTRSWMRLDRGGGRECLALLVARVGCLVDRRPQRFQHKHACECWAQSLALLGVVPPL